MNPAFVGVVVFILRDFISISVLKKLKRRKHFGGEIPSLSLAKAVSFSLFFLMQFYLIFSVSVCARVYHIDDSINLECANVSSRIF